MCTVVCTALSEIQEYLDKDGSKPFLLVEYCHSMGNGPGDFEDYFQMIQDNDKMCGGFVWEWCDHAIAHALPRMERQSMPMEEIMEKKSMTAISVWMDWYIRTERYT